MANSLKAVLFITGSRPGPRLLFHYPPKISLHSPQFDDNNSDSDDEDSTAREPQAVNDKAAEVQADDSGTFDAQGTVLGYNADSLAKLLSPGRWSDRKKFEVRVDGITFVGHPVYAGDEGSWASWNGIDSKEHDAQQGSGNPVPNEDGNTGFTASIAIIRAKPQGLATRDFTHISESLDSHVGPSLATSMNSVTTSFEAPAEQLRMFVVVFALANGSPSDTDDMYRHVAKPLSKALQFCQEQTKYVTVESRRLQSMKATAKLETATDETLWSRMLETSELAGSLKTLYEKLSVGEIAGFRLDGTSISLQIPQDGEKSEGKDILGPHSAIILLDEKDAMLRELAQAEASPLTYFIREHTPAKSLQKHSINLGLPIRDVLRFARHLIRWRKARPIAPLHLRNYYVVEPEADFGHLSDHIAEFSRRFPGLPPLLQMLKMLGGKPIKYGLLIPSRDHRQPFMDVLAYLVRHIFVARLRTFGWLRTPQSDGHDSHIEHRAYVRSAVAGVSLLSPQIQAVEDDAASVSSQSTAIPLPTRAIREEMVDASSSIIVNPLDTLPQTMSAVARIRESVADPELQDFFPRLISYLDGLHPLENVAPLEGLKRAKVDVWLEMLDQQGLLVTFQCL